MKSRKEIKVEEIWNEGKIENLKNFILAQSEKQSKEQRIKNELLAIQFRMEDYIESTKDTEGLKIADFVRMYLHVLNITQKRMADLFEMRDSNFHKYLTGKRKLNKNLVLKLSAFTHTKPEYWLRVEVKNELIEISKEKNKEYQKYDYKNLLVNTSRT